MGRAGIRDQGSGIRGRKSRKYGASFDRLRRSRAWGSRLRQGYGAPRGSGGMASATVAGLRLEAKQQEPEGGGQVAGKAVEWLLIANPTNQSPYARLPASGFLNNGLKSTFQVGSILKGWRNGASRAFRTLPC
jgi:hypothetical protein